MTYNKVNERLTAYIAAINTICNYVSEGVLTPNDAYVKIKQNVEAMREIRVGYNIQETLKDVKP